MPKVTQNIELKLAKSKERERRILKIQQLRLKRPKLEQEGWICGDLPTISN